MTPNRPPPETPDHNREVLNRDVALARFAGDVRLFAQMAQFFLDDCPEMVERIRQGIETDNAEDVARAAHSLKGLAANFEARCVVDVARQIEELARGCRLQPAGERLPELIHQVERLRTELRLYGSYECPESEARNK